MAGDKHRNALVPGYELLWYRVDRVLGQGAFGITYLAHDVNLDRKVAVKEYLPSQLCIREESCSVQPLSGEHRDDFEFGLQRFITEARVLTHFEHPNLIRVFNVFEANNTAYMVMNYEEGASLQGFVKRKKQFTEKGLIPIMLPLMNGLSLMHERGFIHRDIKPGNIFIRNDGTPVLIDFGSARQTRLENPLTLTNFVSPGYAPIEQYASKSDKQGPWTDIYGFGATLYKIITGVAPVNAIDRSETITHDGKDCYISLLEQKPGQYREKFLTAIDMALAFRAQDRPKTIREWRDLFEFDEKDIETQPVPVQPADTATFHVNTDAATAAVDMRKEEPETLRQKNDSTTINLFDPESTTATAIPGQRKVSAKLMVAGTGLALLLIAVTVIVLLPDQSTGTFETDPDISRAPEPVAPEREKSNQDTLAEKESSAEAGVTDLQQQEITGLLQQAEQNIADFRLTSPADDNAHDKYLQVLSMDPDNAEAKAGIRKISDGYISLSYSAIERNEMDRARLYINKAEELWPGSPKIAAADRAYSEALANSSQATDTGTGTTGTGVSKSSGEEAEASVFNDVKKWFRQNAEKNENVEKEDTASDRFIRSLGGSN